jgi:hypothetical protein
VQKQMQMQMQMQMQNRGSYVAKCSSYSADVAT